MSFRFCEDESTADVAFVAEGKSLEEVFTEAARATAAVMVDNWQTLGKKERFSVGFEDSDLETLLVRFLEEIIFIKDAHGVLVVPEAVRINSVDNGFRLSAELAGETLSPEKHITLVDVKAVTWHGLKLEETSQGWRAHVVLDI